ncbi:MAG: DUF3524 domain-containing protein [Pseudomonadota bacterium]
MKKISTPRGVIVSPYHTLSHAYWADGMMRLTDVCDWQLVSLPPRFFGWRIRGNPLALAFDPSLSQALENIDVLVATSMTDLACLKGLTKHLQSVPSVLYFHENQFAYPPNAAEHNNLEAKMVTLYGALAADVVLFNSRFNRDTFFDGAQQMLKAFPDYAPIHCLKSIERKTTVVPVPLPLNDLQAEFQQAKVPWSPDRPLKIVWNHRWEYDKGPERLARIIEISEASRLPFEFTIVGQRFRNIPASLEQLSRDMPSCIKHIGYVESKDTYLAMLASQDVVLSTALHDFQGLSIIEAMALGCLPCVPDRLVYPEYIPQGYRYTSQLKSIEQEAESVIVKLSDYLARLRDGEKLAPPDYCQFDYSEALSRYENLFFSLLAHS